MHSNGIHVKTMSANAKTSLEVIYKVVLIGMTLERPELRTQKTRNTEAWISGD
jgi:hypothetical protein